ncbi:MAG TPA: hypothetical protein VLG92_05445 [Candidatus Saccharimonadia bacterium]|nr:hypothetical protein [Candidatus Saccharimonadia bacterium]
MAATKKTARKVTGARKSSTSSKRPQTAKTNSATLSSYSMQVQLEVTLVLVLSIVFLIFAIVRYT